MMPSQQNKDFPKTEFSDDKNNATDAQIERINELSKTVRTTWLSFLSYSIFVAITLLSVEDADFFIPSRQTQLPLIAISIPTYYFFWIAPTLGAVLYTYLHLHLLKLWDALVKIPPSYKNDPISDSLTPWLLIDLGLGLRNDGSLRQHSMANFSKWVTVFSVFVVGPLVLFYSWVRSFPAHDLWVTVLGNGLPLIVSVIMYWTSWKSLLLLVKEPKVTPKPWKKMQFFLIILYIQVIFFIGAAATQGLGTFASDYLPVRANLVDVDFAERPKNWTEPDTHRRRFFVKWCPKEKQSIPDCLAYFTKIGHNLDDEWRSERENYLSNVSPIDLRFKDLRNARLQGAFMPNADLRNAKLEGADFFQANLEGAQLSDTTLINTNFNDAQLNGSIFIDSDIKNTRFNFAKLDRAYFYNTTFNNVSFVYAKLNRAKFREVHFISANLIGAGLVEAIFDSKTFARSMQYKINDANHTKTSTKSDKNHTSLSGSNSGSNFMSGHLLLHSADLRRVKGLTNEMLINVIGDETTLLDTPLDKKLYIWSCWDHNNTPQNLNLLLDQANLDDINLTKDELRKKVICSEGRSRTKIEN